MPLRLATIARRRAEWLQFARLALTAVSLAIAIGLERPDGELTEAATKALLASADDLLDQIFVDFCIGK